MKSLINCFNAECCTSLTDKTFIFMTRKTGKCLKLFFATWEKIAIFYRYYTSLLTYFLPNAEKVKGIVDLQTLAEENKIICKISENCFRRLVTLCWKCRLILTRFFLNYLSDSRETLFLCVLSISIEKKNTLYFYLFFSCN